MACAGRGPPTSYPTIHTPVLPPPPLPWPTLCLHSAPAALPPVSHPRMLTASVPKTSGAMLRPLNAAVESSRNTEMKCYKFKLLASNYFLDIILFNIIPSRQQASSTWGSQTPSILCVILYTWAFFWLHHTVYHSPKRSQNPKVRSKRFSSLASISHSTPLHPFLTQDSCPVLTEMIPKSSAVNFFLQTPRLSQDPPSPSLSFLEGEVSSLFSR